MVQRHKLDIMREKADIFGYGSCTVSIPRIVEIRSCSRFQFSKTILADITLHHYTSALKNTCWLLLFSSYRH